MRKWTLAVAVLLALSCSMAYAVPFVLNNDGLLSIKAFKLDGGSGSNDHDLNSANETKTIWDAIDGGAPVPSPPLVVIGSKKYRVRWWETDTEVDVNYGGGGGDFGSTRAYATINSDGAGGGGGSITGGADLSVRGETYLAVPVGTWSIAIGSDDGRRLELPGLAGLATPNFIAHGGQVDGGSGTGFDFVLKNGTTGHNRSVGVFTVGLGDVVPGTNIALLQLDGFFFQRSGGIAGPEISIKAGSDTGFGGSGEGWTLLQEGTFGWAISSTPITVTVTPPAKSFTWDGSTDDWRAGAGADTHWEPPAAGNTLFATIADDATVNAGQANVASSNEAALNLTIGGTGTVAVAAGRTLTVDSTLTVNPGGGLANGGAVTALLVNSTGTVTLANGSSLTAGGGTLGDVDIVSGTASLAGGFSATTLDLAAGTTLALNSGSLSTAAATVAAGGATLDVNSGSFNASALTLNARGTVHPAGGTGPPPPHTRGAGALPRPGAATLTLNTGNSYEGQTTVNSGILLITNGGALGNADGDTVVNNGGQLRLDGGFTTPAGEAISINGGANGGALYSRDDTNNIDGPVTLAGDATIRVDDDRLRLRGGVNLGTRELNANVDGGEYMEIVTNAITGSGKLKKEGDGTLEIRINSAAYTGIVDINNGVVDVNQSQGLGTGNVEIDGDATLRLRSNVNMANNIVLSGSAGGGRGEGDQGRIRNDANNNTLSGTIAVNNDSRIDVDGGTTLTLSGAVSGGGNIEKTDTGQLNLTNTANSFTGQLNVGGGTVNVTSVGALGAPKDANVASGATLNVAGGTLNDLVVHGDATTSANLTVNNLTVTSSSLQAGANLVTVNPGGVVSTGAYGGYHDTLTADTGSFAVSGTISKDGPETLILGGPGTVVQAANNFGTILTADVGNPGKAGSLTEGPAGTYTIEGGGSDIWDKSDKFFFAYQPVSGDTEWIARVGNPENTNKWAKAGLMIRETLAGNSKNFFVARTPTTVEHRLTAQRRTSTGGDSASKSANNFKDPYYWLKVVRNGNTYSAYWAPDVSGAPGTWGQVHSEWTRTFGMNSDLSVGLAVTAHDNDKLCTTVFDNVTGFVLGGDVPSELTNVTGEGTIIGDISIGGTLAPGGSVGQIDVIGDLMMDGVYAWELTAGGTDLVYGAGTSDNLTLNDWVLQILDGDVDSHGWMMWPVFQGFENIDVENQSVDVDTSLLPSWRQFPLLSDPRIVIQGDTAYLTGLTTVPEPATMALLGLGALCLARRRKRR